MKIQIKTVNYAPIIVKLVHILLDSLVLVAKTVTLDKIWIIVLVQMVIMIMDLHPFVQVKVLKKNQNLKKKNQNFKKNNQNF